VEEYERRLYWKNPLKWFNPQMASPIIVEHNGTSVTSGQFSLFITSHIGVSRELHELISLCELIWWIHVKFIERLLSFGIYSLNPLSFPARFSCPKFFLDTSIPYTQWSSWRILFKKTKHDIPAVLGPPTQKHASYTMSTGLDEKKATCLVVRSCPKTSIDLIRVAWQVRG
jgi:hypothetical protein